MLYTVALRFGAVGYEELDCGVMQCMHCTSAVHCNILKMHLWSIALWSIALQSMQLHCGAAVHCGAHCTLCTPLHCGLRSSLNCGVLHAKALHCGAAVHCGSVVGVERVQLFT